MSDDLNPRGEVILSERRARHNFLIPARRRTTLDDLPIVPFPTGGDPIVGGTGHGGPQSSAAQRTQTVNAAEGVVPVLFGGPLKCGGYLINTPLIVGEFLYIDIAFGEGPCEALTNITMDDQPISTFGVTAEVHLGVAGDTTSTIMTGVIPTYEIPEYIVHVVLKCPRPTTADYNPLNVKADWSGMLCYNSITAVTEFTTNPVIGMHEAFKNDRFGIGSAPSEFREADWEDMILGCDFDIGSGIKRWTMSIRCDSQQRFEDWLAVWRGHCAAVIQYNDGRWGGYLDLPRDRAFDETFAPIVLTDHGEAPNLVAEASFTQRGRDQVPTVVIVHYTDASNAYADASVMIPEDGPAPGVDWIPQEYTVKGITTREMARRMGTYQYMRLQLDLDFPLVIHQLGMKLLPGDRIGLDSRRILAADEAAPNAGAVDGVEEITIAKLSISGNGQISGTAVLYRDATYGDVIDGSGPPTPTPPPDPYSIPDDPSNLVLPHDGEDDYGRVEFTPAASPYQSYYEILDLWGDPAEPPVVGIVKKEDPINSDGKYHTYVGQAVHGTPETGRAMKVTVRTVTAPAGRKSPGVTAEWTIGSILPPRTKLIYGHAVKFTKFDGGVGAPSTFWNTVRNGSSTGTRTADAALSETFNGDSGGGSFYTEITRTILEFEPAAPMPDDAVIIAAYVDLYVQHSGGLGAPVIHLLDYNGSDTYPFSVAFNWANMYTGTTHGPFAYPVGDGYVRLLIPNGLFSPLVPLKLAFVLMEESDIGNMYVGLRQVKAQYNGDPVTFPGPRLVMIYTSATETAESGGGPAITYQNPLAAKQTPGGGWAEEFRADKYSRSDGKRMLSELNLQLQPLELTGTRNSSNLAFAIPGSDTWIAGSLVLLIDGQIVARSFTSPSTGASTGYSVGGTGNRTITLLVGDGAPAAGTSLAIIGIKDADL